MRCKALLKGELSLKATEGFGGRTFMPLQIFSEGVTKRRGGPEKPPRLYSQSARGITGFLKPFVRENLCERC